MENELRKGEKDSMESTRRHDSTTISLKALIVFFAASILSSVIIDFLPIQQNPWKWDTTNTSAPQYCTEEKTYAIYARSKSEDHLIHVVNVLEKLGYTRVSLEKNWQLLWAHDYPFLKMKERMKRLENYQIVNHFPGCGFLTNKVDLSTSALLFLPRAFRLPSQKDEFLEYTRLNPSALFVEKHNEHRHIVIRSPEEINLNSTTSFVQEYIQNPYLVDGYKFDMGVYVVITSVNPLRIYMYSGDVLFRYCPVKYHPFDASNIDKYIVGDDYLPTWQVPSLIKYYSQFGGSMRSAFDAYVRDQQMDPTGIWVQVEDIIRRTILEKERDIVNILRSYKTRNFFDLMRFDLIVDKNLKVYLMEANMSPNLSSAHFKPNSVLYEQILYNVLNLVGIGTPIKMPDDCRLNAVNEIIATDQSLSTNLNKCASLACHRSCNKQGCDLCLPCLTGSEYDMLYRAHMEHLHRGNMRRLFPPSFIRADTVNINAEIQNMTKLNAWMTRWFFYKCLYDASWCH
ncbi:probable tubulin polyglutamylase ttll-15 [Musca domestica]|uniref:Probable tubulin polyglutamylase ttll-15 n=1 Tax=Musca domestica TaxID=7370 RepID=A0A9J7I7A6_MUSDO|nr:probable tubulin polyglutamylase ttll-15 [Musca domestica]